MPFDAAFDDVYKLGIKGAVAQFDGVVAERVDEQIYREGILERIYRQIEVADIIIADMTGQSPNVFYEVGYAHAKGKLCILLTSNANDIPFDLKHQRHIVYSKSIVTLRRELEKELNWALAELEKQRQSHVKITLQKLDGFGDLKEPSFTQRAISDSPSIWKIHPMIELSIFTLSTSIRQHSGNSIKTTKNVLPPPPTNILLCKDLNDATFCSRHFLFCKEVHGLNSNSRRAALSRQRSRANSFKTHTMCAVAAKCASLRRTEILTMTSRLMLKSMNYLFDAP
jgi:hypothetical protein